MLYLFDLRINNLISESVLHEVLDVLLSFSFRSQICKKSGLTRQLCGSVMQRLDKITDYNNFMDGLWEAITFGKGRQSFPSDTEFVNYLVGEDLYTVYDKKLLKYLFYMLELKAPASKGIQPFDDSNISIEHIMPQTLGDGWDFAKDNDEKYKANLHKFGNLAIVNYNKEMSNKDFAHKKEFYSESKFYYTRRIAENSDWGFDDIRSRSIRLAQEARNIWSLPQKYQVVKANSDVLHTLDEDVVHFTYTKPLKLYVNDREEEVGTWSEFMQVLCGILIEENEDVFLKIVNSKHFGVFKTDVDNCSPNINFAKFAIASVAPIGFPLQTNLQNILSRMNS